MLTAPVTHKWSIIPPTGDLTVTLTPSEYDYDGTAHTPEVTITMGGLTIPAGTYSVSYSDNTNAGTATVTISDNEGGDFDFSTTTATFTILPKMLTVKHLTFDKSKVYDGTTSVANHTYEVQGVIPRDDPNITVAIRYDTPNAGTGKTITATYTLGDANYALAALTEAVATDAEIIPASRLLADYTYTAPANLVYNGEPKAATVTGPGEITIYYSADGGNTWTADAPINADGYIVKISVAADDNHQAADFTADNWAFDILKANRTAPDVKGKPTSLPSKDDGQFIGATTDMEYCLNGSDDFMPIIDPAMLLAAGTYKVRYVASTNYNDSPASIVVIEKGSKLRRNVKDYVVTLPANTTYDGNPKEATVQGDGVITVQYRLGSQPWTTTQPVTPGTYTVRFTVDETVDYYAALFADETWTFEIVRELLVIENLVANSEGYCPGIPGKATYSVVSGFPIEYRAVVASNAAEIKDADFTTIVTEGEFEFSVPNISSDSCNVFIQFREFDGLTSDVYSMKASVNLPNDYMTDIFTDVVSIINKVDLNNPSDLTPRFNAYQWYLDGEEIPGATKPYYQQIGGLEGTYHVRVTTLDGHTLYTCPKTFDGSNKTASLAVYPNPVITIVNIELSVDSGAAHSVTIVDNKGLNVYNGQFTGSHTSVDMSSFETGYYIIIVDNLKANVVKK